MVGIDKTASSITLSQKLKLHQQAQEFEGVFLNMLTKQMFSSLQSDKNFGGGFGEETWRSMQAEQLANTMAQSGGVGIADQMMTDMIALQEAANASHSMNNGPNAPGTGVYGK